MEVVLPYFRQHTLDLDGQIPIDNERDEWDDDDRD